MKTNQFETKMDLVATRSLDARIVLGVLSLEFKGPKIKMVVSNAIRDKNKQLIADIERVIHDHFFDSFDVDNVKKITSAVIPLAMKIDTNI